MSVKGRDVTGMESQLPVGWSVAKLGDVVAEAKAGFACGQRDDSGVIQLRMNNVDTRGNFLWNDFIRVPAEQAEIDEYRLLPGDVLFNNTNSTELVGKTALFGGHCEPVVYSNHFTRIRVVEDRLDAVYLSFWLNAQWQRGIFARICNRWIGQSAVKADKLLALTIPLPPLPEQKRIAGIVQQQMAAVEQARCATGTRLQAAKQLPIAYLESAFALYRSKAWPEKRIEDFAGTCSGATPSRGQADYFIGRIPWVKTGELRDSTIEDTEEHVSDKALEDCSLPLLPVGTLLIAMYGQGQTRGRTGLLACTATTNQACFAIRPNPDIFDTRYLQLWFRYNYQRLRKETESRGGNQPNLNGVLLRRQKVCLPPVAVQHEVVDEFVTREKSIDSLCTSLRDEWKAVNALPASILHRAFAGGL